MGGRLIKIQILIAAGRAETKSGRRVKKRGKRRRARRRTRLEEGEQEEKQDGEEG